MDTENSIPGQQLCEKLNVSLYIFESVHNGPLSKDHLSVKTDFCCIWARLSRKVPGGCKWEGIYHMVDWSTETGNKHIPQDQQRIRPCLPSCWQHPSSGIRQCLHNRVTSQYLYDFLKYKHTTIVIKVNALILVFIWQLSTAQMAPCYFCTAVVVLQLKHSI